MYQSLEIPETFELKEYTIDMLIEFIEMMYKKKERCKFLIYYTEKGKDKEIRMKVACYSDYYRGQVVSLSPQGGKHADCPVKDPGYRAFVKKMVQYGENANSHSY